MPKKKRVYYAIYEDVILSIISKIERMKELEERYRNNYEVVKAYNNAILKLKELL